MKLGSLQLRVMLYVARHNEAKLTAAQIAERFHFDARENVTTALRRSVYSGWLVRHETKPVQYGAGPQLLRVVRIEV